MKVSSTTENVRHFAQVTFPTKSFLELFSYPFLFPKVIRNMTSISYAEEIQKKITDETTHPMAYYEPQFYLPENHGTSHISVVAEDGSAVAATSTINRLYVYDTISAAALDYQCFSCYCFLKGNCFPAVLAPKSGQIQQG